MTTYNDNSMEKMRSGQRIVILGIALNLLSLFFRFSRLHPSFELILVPVYVGAIVVSGIGIFRTTQGLGFAQSKSLMYAVGMIAPILSLILLGVVSDQVTKILRNNGYHVGIFGAARKSA